MMLSSIPSRRRHRLRFLLNFFSPYIQIIQHLALLTSDIIGPPVYHSVGNHLPTTGHAPDKFGYIFHRRIDLYDLSLLPLLSIGYRIIAVGMNEYDLALVPIPTYPPILLKIIV